MIYLSAMSPRTKYGMTNTFRQSLRQLAAALKAERDLRHPFVVSQYGLTHCDLGEQQFRSELDERRRWIEQNRSAPFAFDALPNGTGREYRFESFYDAVHFMLRFGTRVVPRRETR